MTLETIIHHYNRLNGNSITRSKLKEFHGRVQKALDNNSHGPLVKDVRGILGRVTNVLKQNFDVIDRVNLTPIEVKKVEPVKVEGVKKVAPKKVAKKKTPAVKPAPKPAIKKKPVNRKPATKPKVVKQPAKQPVASSQQPVAVTKSLSGVNYQYYALPLGEFEAELYKINSDSNAMFWGKPGHGKTVKMLKLAQHFAQQGKKVHYISEEEYGKSTFDEKLIEHNIGHPNLSFSGDLNESDIAASEIIFFDSVNTLELKPQQVKALDKKYPNRLFVLIVQTTKDGQFRGGRDWEHLVDVAGEISNRKIILHKNRFDKENPEKMSKLMTEDAIAEATKRYKIRSAVKANVQPSKSTLTI